MAGPRSRKGWKSKCDKLWSLHILSRDKVCRCCGKLPAKHPHHLISRRYHSTRFIPTNGVGLCVKCHFMAHQNPIAFHAWMVDNIGQTQLNQLNEFSQRIEKLDYVKVCSDLETKGVD
jgi:hypothetical protein